MIQAIVFVILALQAAPRTITLTWEASPTPGVTYSVYRAAASCASNPAMAKVASGVAALTWDDKVSPGRYCYYVTAVLADPAGDIESVPSNLAGATAKPWPPGKFDVTVP